MAVSNQLGVCEKKVVFGLEDADVSRKMMAPSVIAMRTVLREAIK